MSSLSSQHVSERIETALRETKAGPRSLLQCMSDYKVHGASIAVIHDYQVEWARGYGVREVGMPDPVDDETLFQACSISKPVSAVAVLRLVEQGRLDLDADVNDFLTSWEIPANGTWQPRVTLRQLLSHSAGTSVSWFFGYHPEQDIPSLLAILNGDLPANTPAITVTTIPGLQFRYSGGGYSIVQQVLIDVMKQPFPQLMRNLVFEPLSMEHSTYEQYRPSEQWRNSAVGHRASGKLIAGKRHIFPEMAAGGLWTTASDLARFSLSLQNALAGKPDQLLSQQMVHELLTPQRKGDSRGDMGLGVFVQGEGDTARFGHPGDNLGFSCCWLALMKEGQGCVIMTNSDNGWSLQERFLKAVAQVYEWPSMTSHNKRNDAKTLDIHDNYIGDYEINLNLCLKITKTSKTLFLHIPGQSPMELMKENDATYLLPDMNDTITFVKNENGHVESLILQQELVEVVAIKR